MPKSWPLVLPAGGATTLEAPAPGEDLFLYITDGTGQAQLPARIDARDHVTIRVWERGAGLTKACGTAACAVMAAGFQ